jgi:hypothetical protein
VKWGDSVREAFHQWKINRPIWQRLDQSVTLRHPNRIPLDQLLNQLKPLGLMISCDPEGLQDANQDINAIVKIDVQSIKAKDALELALKPLGLRLFVHGGMATITGAAEFDSRPEEHPETISDGSREQE